MSLDLNPESDLVSASDLHAALRPHQTDIVDFEAGVFQRIQAAEMRRASDPLADAPPLTRVAASIFPLQILTGGKVTAGAAPLANGPVLYKVISILAMPATLILMLGVAVWSAIKIRQVQLDNMPERLDPAMLNVEVYLWWHRHRWAGLLCFAVTLVFASIGATSLMLLVYLVSVAALLGIVSSLTKLGLANRRVVAGALIPALAILGQASAFGGIGQEDIHFLDQKLLPVALYIGIILLLPAMLPIRGKFVLWNVRAACFAAFLVLTIVMFSMSTWWPITRSQIKQFVEKFDHARFSTSSWRTWEIVAGWTIESGLNPDLSAPRKLFEKEFASNPKHSNGSIVGNAARTGLVPPERLQRLVDFEQRKQSLLNSLPQHQITSLAQTDWVIRVCAELNDLSSAQKDLLEQRLLATMKAELVSEHTLLEDVLRVTQLLDVIGRPLNLNQYRRQVHSLLREFHTTSGSGFQFAGGFRHYRRLPVGSLEPTSYAVELMKIYGVPDGLDLNWVRSYLRPPVYQSPGDKCVSAITLDRLNHLPGVTFPTWLDYLYYERTLVMAVLLVAICCYATYSSPALQDDLTTDNLKTT